MSEWKAKRFWTDATVAEEDGGFGVRLDARPVRTPGKAALLVPTRELADRIAAEWQAQEGIIDPLSMPFTRSANSAIDKVRPQLSDVAGIVAAYGDSDLLCYRAESPKGLVSRQSAIWDPYLDWAEDTLGARLLPRTGLMYEAQPDDALSILTEEVNRIDAFALTALHDLVALSGSLIIGLAVARDHVGASDGWDASRVDEDWQAEQWGVDDEAQYQAGLKRDAFLHAKEFLDAVRKG